jgi:phosphopantetheinyl transferase
MGDRILKSLENLEEGVSCRLGVNIYLAAGKNAVSRLAAQGEMLDGTERATARRFYCESDAQTYTAAHVLLRLSLSRHAGPRPETWRFVRLPGGRPEVDAGIWLGRQPLRFSLSHTSELVC